MCALIILFEKKITSGKIQIYKLSSSYSLLKDVTL